MASLFSEPWDLVVDLLAATISTAIACFMVPCRRMCVGCKADPEYFRVWIAAVVRKLAKVALDADTDAVLSVEAAECAIEAT